MTKLQQESPLDQAQNQLAKHGVNVHKFGGSSLASTACIERVIGIIKQNCQLGDLVVVSANGNTTDALFSLYQLANESVENSKASNTEALQTSITELYLQQKSLLASLLKSSHTERLNRLLIDDITQLTSWLTTNAKQHHSDILAFGELWSARLLSAVLNERVCPSYYLDAREFLVINNSHDCAVDYATSAAQFNQQTQFGKLAVVTGYISKDSHGSSCTLGRNGSDYSATIMAALTAAKNVTLWTDVDGIYSADPRVVPSARKLNRLNNGVAKELGRLGNPVLHAQTLKPLTQGLIKGVVNKNKQEDSTYAEPTALKQTKGKQQITHLHVASSFAPEITGTEIGEFGQIAKQELSVTFLNDLLLAQSSSFIGDSAEQACQEFNVLCADSQKGFIVITQQQQKAVSQWLASHDTEVEFTPISLIATVGHKVINQGNVQAHFKRALKSAQPLELVNSKSEHSIIALLAQPCTSELLNRVHHAMTKDARHIGVVVAGLGNIGQRFLDLLPEQLLRVPALENVHLVGMLSSKKALINNDGLDAVHALSLFEERAQNYDNDLLMSWLSNHPYDELIVIDITPSEHFSLLYRDFFQQGIHVIGANKWAASSETDLYNELIATADQNHSLWLGNTTVGAGLPINATITDLLNSGDEISEISGIFSGTLSWLFASYDGAQPFSKLLQNALQQGITEPDPREDLSGRDVQRKLLILARAIGFELSLDDIACQNLVPESLQNLSIEEFLVRSAELDDFFVAQLENALLSDNCIRYVARFSAIDKTTFKAQVSLEVLPQQDAFANLTPCDNIFQIKSRWYQDNPLIIRGPGAGRDVTAGGIHSDLVTICQQLTTKQHQVKIKGIN
jgi:aspartokinase/homoserine dehydrogenase 2